MDHLELELDELLRVVGQRVASVQLRMRALFGLLIVKTAVYDPIYQSLMSSDRWPKGWKQIRSWRYSFVVEDNLLELSDAWHYGVSVAE